TMKSLDNLITKPDLDQRQSTTILCSKGRTHIDILSEDFCRGWRDAINSTSVGEEYGAWLVSKKLDDNMSNRIRYTLWLNEEIQRGNEPNWIKQITKKKDGQ